MPNWVYNTLTVSGDEALLELFKQRVSSPYQFMADKYEPNKPTYKVEETVESVFSFYNIVRPPADKLGLYFASSNGKEDKTWNWYHWNIQNWGTKWDASDATIENETDKEITFRFDTAWSSPAPVFLKVSEQYPELKFNLEYEEEQGWGGKVSYQNGVETEIESWDIPNSHADYVKRGKECCCSWDEEPSDWYADCPKP